MIVIQILLTTYLLGVFLFGALVFSAVFRLGGWNNFVNQANSIAKAGGKDIKFSPDRIQWLCAFIIMCWPVVPFMVSRALKRP